MQDAKMIRKQLRELRAEMRAMGIKKTSPFNGGMDRETQRWNERRFALETELERATRVEIGRSTLSEASEAAILEWRKSLHARN